jgi:GST-like protein
VLERQLSKSKYVACEEYTIADMATAPWLRFPERQGVNIEEFPALKRWRDALLERPAVKRALDVLKDARRAGEMSKEQKENLFGAAQYAKR